MVVRGMAKMALVTLLLRLLGPGPAQAAKASARLSWVRGEGWWQAKTAPARFHPGQLLDGKTTTVFCVSTEENALAEASFTVGFGGRARVRELRIVNGDMRSKATFARSARVAKLTLLEPAYERSIVLADTQKRQIIRLDPPLAADRVTFRIDAVHGDGARVCLTDILFIAGRKALNGPALARHLRWRGLASRIQGRWAAGPPGAPEKYLTLSFEGRFRFVYRPNDPDLKGFALGGTWSLRGKRLRLLGAGPPVLLGLKLARHDDEMGELVHLLELKGKARGKKKILPDRYRDRF